MADSITSSFIRRLPLFAYLSAPQLDAVASAFQQSRYLPGDRLYRQGDHSQALYCFVSGEARQVQFGTDKVEREIGVVRAGECLGETSLFVAEPQESSLVATQESIVLVLTKAQFEAVLAAHPDIRQVLNIRKDVMDSLQTQRQRHVRSDEVVVLMTRRHPWVFAGKALRSVVVFAVLVGLALASTYLPVSVPVLPFGLLCGALIIPAVMTLFYFLDWRNDFFIITNQRIIHEEHYLLTGAEQRWQALLSSVQNVNVSRQGPIAEVVGFGDVVVNTIGSEKPLILDKISSPLKVQQTIFAQVQQRKEQAEGPEAIRAQVDALFGGPAATSGPPLMGPSYRTRPPSALERVLRAVLPPPKLEEGDRVTYHKHWIVLIGNLWKPIAAYGLLGVLLGVRFFMRVEALQKISGLWAAGLGLIWLMLNTFWLYWAYASWLGDVYIVDNKWIIDIVRNPLFLRETRIQASLQQIQNVTSAIQNVWGQLFSFGDVIIQTAAEHGAMTFNDVYRPGEVAEDILRRVQQATEQQSRANQEAQRRIVSEYLAAYHQAAQREAPQQPNPPVQQISQRPAPKVISDERPTVQIVPPKRDNPAMDQTQSRRIESDTTDGDTQVGPPKPPNSPL